VEGDKQYLNTIYEDDATNANTIEDESLAVKAVDDLDLRPTTLSGTSLIDLHVSSTSWLGVNHIG
jgi:hypothetical protein